MNQPILNQALVTRPRTKQAVFSDSCAAVLGSLSQFEQHVAALTERVLAGQRPSSDELAPLALAPDEWVHVMLPAARQIRERLAPKGVQLCTIRNIKSGSCSEDCRFCTQARNSQATIEEYPLIDAAAMGEFLQRHAQPPLHRASLVSAGRKSGRRGLAAIAEGLHSAKQQLAAQGRDTPPFCGSLGLLTEDELRRLYEAGMTRYHCNLETARSLFPQVCSSHSYDEKLATIAAARRVGMTLCVGALFGMGESDAQLLELALDLQIVDPEAVPVNFLVYVPGVALTEPSKLTPERCLKILALLRFALPNRDILVCGGRLQNLGDRHPEIFSAGVSGMMTGDYLTTAGRSVEQDLELLQQLGESLRAHAIN